MGFATELPFNSYYPAVTNNNRERKSRSRGIHGVSGKSDQIGRLESLFLVDMLASTRKSNLISS